MITLTHEEAQQVLDALEEAANVLSWEGFPRAVQTLRAKLSAPEIPNNLPISNLGEDELMYPTRPEPEPVAYLLRKEFGFGYETGDREDYGAIPVYTALPQREWQGLTDEEIDAIGRDEWVGWPSYDSEFTGIYRLLEAKLREKNT